ncbi:hypothetical protein JZU68_05605, partial [bacterium]|nr:hypothetical protein [bacterium]
MDKKTELIDENSEINKLLSYNIKSQINTVNCFCKNKTDGSIWIGGDGILARVFKRSNKFVFENITEYLESLTLNNRTVTSLFCDSKNRMWLGTRNGVFLFSNSEIKVIIPDLNNVISFCEEKNGIIWIASPSKGIVRVSESKPNTFISKQYTLSKGNINSNEINSIIVDLKGRIWAGTN